MSYSGLIFNTIPYDVRDADEPIYPEKELENYFLQIYGSKRNVLVEVLSVFHDDKHCGNMINVGTRTTDDIVWLGEDKGHNIGIVFDCPKQNIIKAMTNKIN